MILIRRTANVGLLRPRTMGNPGLTSTNALVSYSTTGKTCSSNALLNDHHHCVDLVKRRDREGYLCGLLQPSGASRDAFFALRAFNVEIASIKDQSQSHTAQPNTRALQTRLQWWRESLRPQEEEDTANFDSHPVVRSLRRAIGRWDLTVRFLDRLVDARERDLSVESYETLQDLVTYAEDTSCCLLYLHLESVGVNYSDAADTTAYHIGIAHTLATALRSTLYVVANRGSGSGDASPLPMELLRRHGVPSTWPLHTEEYREALRAVVREIASLATQHLEAARALQMQVPAKGKVALLSAVGVDLYLDKLRSVANYDLLDDRLYEESSGLGPTGAAWHPLLLGRAWLTGVF